MKNNKTHYFENYKDNTVKPVLSVHSKKTPKLVFNTDYLSFSIKAFVLSIFEWPLKAGFTVLEVLYRPRLTPYIQCQNIT